jgi:CubicO group peptidase (beta-lactamase class C family)
VRRITGKSLGRYWREEVAEPLGIDCHIGLAAELDARVAEFIPIPPGEPDFEAQLLKNAPPMAQKVVNNPPRTVADATASFRYQSNPLPTRCAAPARSRWSYARPEDPDLQLPERHWIAQG